MASSALSSCPSNATPRTMRRNSASSSRRSTCGFTGVTARTASEMVEHLERDGLVERMRDPKDKRRSLVWLSDKGLALLDCEREVLSSDLLARVMTCMKATDRRALLRGMHALIETDRKDGSYEGKR